MTSLENNLKISFKGNHAFRKDVGRIRSKVICTIGPRTAPTDKVGKLVEAGMNIARLNFSHGTHEYHASVIKNLRTYLAQSGRMCGIMLDTKGPEIRTGKLEGGIEIRVETGKTIVLTNDFSFVGNPSRISHSYQNMHVSVSEGSEILIDDGLVSLTCVSVDEATGEVTCRVNNDGVIGETKGVNLPGASVDLPALTEKDKADLKFGCEQRVDMVAASFIRKASDVTSIREYLTLHGGENIEIISKIENQEGLENFDGVLAESDGIMVARGDMGVEIPIEMVSVAQKMMISKCNVAGKSVITATQMLDSMIKNPRPTRAETTDVANAVLDGSDCVMLSGETAKGDYPVESVNTMVDICREAEKMLDYVYVFQSLRNHHREIDSISVTETICSSAVKTAYDVKAALIVCLTETGNTGRLVCKYRPVSPVICVTSNEMTARQMLLHRGAFPMVVGSMVGTESLIARVLSRSTTAGLAKKGDFIVLVSGMREGVSGGANILRVIKNE
uniref:Pyruvate kinase n=1 Tax=Dumontia simplex TaxID=142491 RepID=A0A097IU62_9FLOR|nr:pyruvate kinase [Dumontia simplex]